METMENLNGHSVNYELLGKYLAGECTPEEAAQVELWLQNPENRRELEALKAIWEHTEVQPATVDVDRAWTRVAAHMSETKVSETPRRSRVPMWMAAAAVLLVAFGLWWTLGPGVQTPPEIKWLTASNSTEENLSLELPDGSEVTLQTGSKLRFAEAFAGDERRVQLTGQAFFEVEKNPAKPFVVETQSGAEVKVLGTRFNVSQTEGVVVQVTEGKVRLSAPGSGDQQVVLTAGMGGRFDPGTGSVQSVEADANQLYWKHGRLEFDRTPLKRVIRTLRRELGIEIALSNPALESCRLTAAFHHTPIESIFKVISESLDLEVTQDGTQFTLSGEGC